MRERGEGGDREKEKDEEIDLKRNCERIWIKNFIGERDKKEYKKERKKLRNKNKNQKGKKEQRKE